MRKFPETSDQLSSASLTKRLAAMVYDTLLVVSLWMLIGGIGVALNGGEAAEGPVFKSVLFLVTFFFFTGFWTSNGQTLGMQAWRLRIQTEDGYSIGWMQAMIRFFMALVSLLFAGLGYLWILIDKDKRSWHDKYSDSIVVSLPKPVKKKKSS